MSGILYVVGTPIGNLKDMSPRAIDTLSNVDFIAVEDTRVTIKLLNHFEIKKPMISYHEHNLMHKGNEICQRILNGENCAIVTDAGMPAISDPGEILVRQCNELGIKTVCVPGPSALISALAISGMPTGRFTFEGFLSMNKKSRIKHLEEIKEEKRTIIFYEGPHKLLNTLNDLLKYLGDREISLVREITKIHEEVVKTTISKAINMYEDVKIKGEFVLVIKGYENDNEITYTIKQAKDIAQEYVDKGMSLSQACKESAKITNIKKGDIYKTFS